ncbi:hypothetical protein PPACK8108_LOCUS170 [Phakopsora pachyrhizi]|uniref:Uncharacterized protein n=1 Tax=Phakopsora pachyrhizi TaxID=170000 RepID=A0AAV0ADI6_PHAPC|nr:hypothetical protein PPACK8108_LOCUS170 [Phakopsora pachyrhizi]
MPDWHRMRFLMNLRDTRSFDQKVLELEANHLNELASLKPTQLIVPINLRAEPSFKDSDSIDNPIHRWSYQLPFINHFETIHTGPLVSLISHGGLSVGLSLMDSL